MTCNKITLSAIYAVAPLTLSFAQQSSSPNVIIIMTDQQSYNMVTAHGNDWVSTPNIDRIARNGVSFSNSYCANPVSVPSRFSLFTGMYGSKYNITENSCDDINESDIRELLSSNAMGNLFKQAGYETVYGGKVHLPCSALKGTSKFAPPQGYGFDNYITKDEREGLGIEGAKFINSRSSEKPFLLVLSFLNPHDICLESSTNLSSEVYQNPSKPEIANTINRVRAEIAAYDSIFFYDNLAPELPFNFSQTEGFPKKFNPNTFKDFPDYYWRKYRWIYARLVNMVDDHIGVVLDALDSSSIKDNTIVIFTSDHGEMQGAHHTTVKNHPYEECQRVPFIISGPSIPKNRKHEALVCNGTDLLPTICDLVGIDIPKTDGVSLANHAKFLDENSPREFLYLEGDGFTQIVEERRYKYTLFDIKDSPDMLIDLENDNGELFNISEKEPNKSDQLKSILEDSRPTSNSVVRVNRRDRLSLYPNPTKDILWLESNSKSIRLFSINGQDLTSLISYQEVSSTHLMVNTSALPKGVYIITTTSESAILTIE